MPAEKVAHGKAGVTHLCSFFNKPDTAKPNGTVVEAKPRNKIGGCITIQ